MFLTNPFMPTIRKHMGTNIEGMLRYYKKKKMTGLLDDENGKPMSDQAIRTYLGQCLAKGWKLIPSGNCEGFDHFGGGCPGHPVEEECNQQPNH